MSVSVLLELLAPLCIPCAIFVEPSGVQALKNPNPLKDGEGWLCLLLLSYLFR